MMCRSIPICLVLAAWLACFSAFAGETPAPAKNSDEIMKEVETWIGQLEDADVTKVTLAAAALLDQTRNEKTPPSVTKRIRLAIQSRLQPGGSPPQTLSVLLKVLSQKKERFYNRDIVSLACRSEGALFEQAIEALRQIGDPSVLDEFIAIFKDTKNALRVRVVAIRALNHLKGWKGIDELILVGSTGSDEIRTATQQSLEGITGFPFAMTPDGWKKWWDANKAKKHEDILYEAIDRLRSTITTFIDSNNFNDNLRALKSGIRQFQEQGLSNLRASGNAMAIPGILEYIETGPGPNLREQAIGILGELSVKEEALKDKLHVKVAEKLVTFLPAETKTGVIRSTLEALGKIGRVEGVDLIGPIIPYLKHDDVEVVAHAARSIGNIDGKEAGSAVAPLCDVLSHRRKDEDPRREAAIALGKIGSPEAVPALGAGLNDPSVNVRRNCANALGLIKDPASRPPLEQAISSEQEDRVLEAMVKSLRSLGHPDSITVLARLILRSETLGGKSMEAILALGEKHDEKLWEAGDILAQGGKTELAMKLVTAVMSRADTPENRRRKADFFSRNGKYSEAVTEYMALLEAKPDDADLFQRMLRALCQISDPSLRGRKTANAMARYPAKAEIFWGLIVRDCSGVLSGKLDALCRGMVQGFVGVKEPEVVFKSLTGFLLSPDGKVASAANTLLQAWTKFETEAIPEDAPPGLKKQVLTAWENWWTENGSKFPFPAE